MTIVSPSTTRTTRADSVSPVGSDPSSGAGSSVAAKDGGSSDGEGGETVVAGAAGVVGAAAIEIVGAAVTDGAALPASGARLTAATTNNPAASTTRPRVIFMCPSSRYVGAVSPGFRQST